MEWRKSDEKRYWVALESLPPAARTRIGFLMGEPYDHNAKGQPLYHAFVEQPAGQFFESVQAMTVEDFRDLSPRDIRVAAGSALDNPRVRVFDCEPGGKKTERCVCNLNECFPDDLDEFELARVAIAKSGAYTTGGGASPVVRIEIATGTLR